MYEFVKGDIDENTVNAEKYARLRERKFISDDNKVMDMLYGNGTFKELTEEKITSQLIMFSDVIPE